jgi:hypothetical protein
MGQFTGDDPDSLVHRSPQKYVDVYMNAKNYPSDFHFDENEPARYTCDKCDGSFDMPGQLYTHKKHMHHNQSVEERTCLTCNSECPKTRAEEVHDNVDGFRSLLENTLLRIPVQTLLGPM